VSYLLLNSTTEVLRDGILPWASSVGVLRDWTTVWAELLGVSVDSGTLPWHSLRGGVSGEGTVPFSHVLTVLTSGQWPWSMVQLLARDSTTVEVEWGGGVSTTTAPPLEALVGVLHSGGPVPTEYLLTVGPADGVLRWAVTTSVLASGHTLPLSTLVQVLRDGVVGGPSTTAQTAPRTMEFPWQSVLGVRASVVPVLERLLRVASTVDVPVSWQGALLITRDGVFPVEYLASLLTSGELGFENLMLVGPTVGTTVVNTVVELLRSGILPLSTLTTTVQEPVLRWDNTVVLVQDRTTLLSLLQGVGPRDVASPLESLQWAVHSGEIPVGWQGQMAQVLRSSTLPLEWLQRVLTSGGPVGWESTVVVGPREWTAAWVSTVLVQRVLSELAPEWLHSLGPIEVGVPLEELQSVAPTTVDSPVEWLQRVLVSAGIPATWIGQLVQILRDGTLPLERLQRVVQEGTAEWASVQELLHTLDLPLVLGGVPAWDLTMPLDTMGMRVGRVLIYYKGIHVPTLSRIKIKKTE